MGYLLVKQPEPNHFRRVSCVAGVLRVSSKLGSSHRTLTTPVEAYAPPCKGHILPFWRALTKCISARSGFASARQLVSDGVRHVTSRRKVGATSAQQRPNGGKLPS